MSKVKLYFSKFLLAFFLVIVSVCFTGLIVNATAPETSARSALTNFVAQSGSKKELVNQLLSSIGIASQYDMYFDHAIGISITSSDTKYRLQMKELMAREAGWKYVKDDYVTRLSADFSVTELKELLRLSKLPVMQRLLRSEIQAYNATAPKRYKLLNELWNNYNDGQIKLP
jgi:hypothetical protein